MAGWPLATLQRVLRELPAHHTPYTVRGRQLSRLLRDSVTAVLAIVVLAVPENLFFVTIESH